MVDRNTQLELAGKDNVDWLQGQAEARAQMEGLPLQPPVHYPGGQYYMLQPSRMNEIIKVSVGAVCVRVCVWCLCVSLMCAVHV